MEEVSSLDRLLPFVEQPLYYTNASPTEDDTSSLQPIDNSNRQAKHKNNTKIIIVNFLYITNKPIERDQWDE